MSRLLSRAIPLATVVALALGVSAVAQFKESESPPRPPVDSKPADQAPQLVLPGFLPLGFPQVQKELGLSREQKGQLAEISAAYQAKVQDINEALQRLSPEEQRRRIEGLRGRERKDVAAIRKQVAEVLTPEQFQLYETIEFRLRVTDVLTEPRLLDAVGASPAQKTRLRQLRGELEEKVLQLQREAAEKTLQILTPRQQEKLKDEFRKQTP